MFFQKTINAASLDFPSIESKLLEQLKTGIVAEICKLETSQNGIFFTLPSEKIVRVLLYQAKFRQNEFNIESKRVVHLCGCEKAQILLAQNAKSCIAQRPQKCEFSLCIVGENGREISFFNDMPLGVCSECLGLLKEQWSGNLAEFLGSNL